MSADKVRVGIIGAGQIARFHLDRYAEIADRATVVAIADANPAVAKEVGERYKIPHVYTSAAELLKRDDIEAVDVCLHNNLHRPATELALKAGKHVYCEKPIAGAYRDGAAMIEAARQAGKKLHIQMATLYAKETRAARELISLGELGEIYHARSTGFRRRGRAYIDGYGSPPFAQKKFAGGGAIIDMGVYHIAQVLYLIGNPTPTRISGKAYQKVAADPKRCETANFDVEELGVGFVRFAGDLTMDFIESWAIHLGSFQGSTIAGTKGGLCLDPFGFYKSYGLLDIDGTTDLEKAGHRWDGVADNDRLYGNSQKHWMAALRGQVELLPTAEIALNTALISEGIYLSSERGQEVSAEEVKAASVSSAIAL